MSCLLKIYMRQFFVTPKKTLKSFWNFVFWLLLLSFSFPAQAAICFLPDCGDKTTTPNTNKDAQKCKDEGYESFQNRVCSQYSIIDFCPYNSDYIKCNNKQWCILNDYTKTECEKPYELTDKCLNGELMYRECKMNMEDACLEEDKTYTDTCPAGWVIDPNDHCSLSDEFGHCCNTCPGFTTKEEIEAAGKTPVASCDSCDGKKYIAATDGYNSCEGYWDCQDGCAPDAKTCVSFGVTKCDKCKRCEAKCQNETCPEGAVCEYEACTWRYCDPTGCKVGYTYLCTLPETTDCGALGYTTNMNACDGMGMVACPFDKEKVYCIPDNGDCCNVLCLEFKYKAEDIPAGYVSAGTCYCCGKEMHTIEKRDCTGYEKLENCQYGSSGQTCQTGDTVLHKCKDCPNACEFKVCPEGSVCKQDTCSQTYCVTGCAAKYQNYCTTPITDCEELGYTMIGSECAAGVTVLHCPYDTNKVYCNPVENVSCEYYCNEYPYTSIPSGFIKTAEKNCCGKTYYQAEANPCTGFDYLDEDCEFGGDTTAGTCLSGTVTKYKQCKECADACSYEVCPEGTNCIEEPCSKTQCPVSCKTNYKYYCALPETDCDALGYRFVNTECIGREIIRCPYNPDLVYCN